MKTERNNVKFPLWRKKVDSSLFEHKGTTIPLWVCEMWGVDEDFCHCASKKLPESAISIFFQDKKYEGYITVTHPSGRNIFRLWYGDDLAFEIKHAFVMSYMRDLESRLRKNSNAYGAGNDGNDSIEEDIPFWEFLDIEFDRAKIECYFTGYYYQKPTFPELFRRLITSPMLKKIDDELYHKNRFKAYPQGWKSRDDLETEVGAVNVIYYLLDTESERFYVGEAKDLVKRLKQKHPTIPQWNYFRYNVLPDGLANYRLCLERMLIKDMSEIGCDPKDGHREQNNLGVLKYLFANNKIDK